jgi:hypothetical protein
VAPLHPQRVPQVVPRLGVRGAQLERAPAGCLGLDRAALLPQDRAEVAVEVREVRVGGHRAFDEDRRGVVPAELVRDHAEQVQGVGVLGIRGEDPLVALRGLRQSPGPVMRERLLQHGVPAHDVPPCLSSAPRADPVSHQRRHRRRYASSTARQ